MEELLLPDNFSIKSLYDQEMEDFDSGCSSVPSSPSAHSDFSIGSHDDDITDDFTIRRNDAIKMGQSILDGGPILNPYIKVSTEIYDDQIDDFLPESAEELLGIFTDTDEFLGSGCFEMQQRFPGLFDIETSLVPLSAVKDLDPSEDSDKTEKHCTDVEEQLPSQSKTRRSQTKKMSIQSQDHTYAHKETSTKTPEPTVRKNNRNKIESTQDNKYLEKRRKNNLAAKRSRELKRAKEIENMKKCETLAKENTNLRKEMNKLQAVVSRLENKLKRL